MKINDIIKEVCQYLKVDYDLFMSKTRRVDIVEARQIAMYLSHQEVNISAMNYNYGIIDEKADWFWSLSFIGQNIGNKDHSTVLHAINKINNMYDTNDPICFHIDCLKTILKQKREGVTISKDEIYKAIISGLCELVKIKDKHIKNPEEINQTKLFQLAS